MKNLMIVLVVIAGLMFGAFIGAVGGIYFQSGIDKAVKEAELAEKDRELKALADKLAGASQNVEVLKRTVIAMEAKADEKVKAAEESQKQTAKEFFSNKVSVEKIIKQAEQGDFSEVEQYIDTMVKTLPPAYIRDFLKENLGLSDEDLPKDDAKLGEFGKSLFRLLQGEQPKSNPEQAIEEISFALRVNSDNSPISPTSAFMPGDRRIYACFQNQGSLKGLSKVITRWTCKTTKEIIGFGPKPLNTASPYNFIWWEKREGWTVGEYLVELLSTNEFALLGRGAFMVMGEVNKKESKADKPKDDQSADDIWAKQKGAFKVNMSVQIGTLMEYIGKRKNKIIVYADASIKKQDCAHVFPVFYLTAENYDNIMCSILEKALLLRGYKLIKDESIWEVVKLDEALIGKIPQYADLDAIRKIPSGKKDIIVFIQPMYLDVSVLTVELNKSKDGIPDTDRPNVFFTPYPKGNKLVITGPAYLVRDYCISIITCDQKGVLFPSQDMPFVKRPEEPATKIKYPYPVVFDVSALNDWIEEFTDMGIKDIPTDESKVAEYLVRFFKSPSVGTEKKEEETEKDK